VWGPLADSAAIAAGLRRAGLPTELFTDEVVSPELSRTLIGVDVRPVTDPGPPMAGTGRTVPVPSDAAAQPAPR